MIETAEQLAEEIGVKCACRVLGVARSSLYRIRQAKMIEPVPPPEPIAACSAPGRKGNGAGGAE